MVGFRLMSLDQWSKPVDVNHYASILHCLPYSSLYSLIVNLDTIGSISVPHPLVWCNHIVTKVESHQYVLNGTVVLGARIVPCFSLRFAALQTMDPFYNGVACWKTII